MDHEQVWRHVAEQRRAAGRILTTIDEAEWAMPSACPGWTVKDVAAHLIAHPQQTWGSFLPAMVRGRLSFDRAVLVDGQRRGRVPVADLLRQFDEYADARRLPPTTTPLEALIDVLVHTQDALRPLGREHAMPPEAAAVATERAFTQAKYFGHPDLDGVRLVASDHAWARGDGPTVAAPMQEILMLATGRPAAAALVSGEGRHLVRTA